VALGYEDKEAMIVHSCFSILVFSEAFHTPHQFQDRSKWASTTFYGTLPQKIKNSVIPLFYFYFPVVFPDGLSGFRNLSVNFIKERSGLIPTVVAVINNILVGCLYQINAITEQ
jgi:hypothetical protein